MAVRLELLSVIIPRASLVRCADLPEHLRGLSRDGGVVLDVTWYDAHLYREGAMSEGDVADIALTWGERGLVLWRDFTVAASRTGPRRPCEWLEYDDAENCVWLKGTDRGEIIGGHAWVRERTARMAALEAEGERAYGAMYEAAHPKDDYDDARGALSRARDLARFLHRTDVVTRLDARIAHIAAVYDSQFRGF